MPSLKSCCLVFQKNFIPGKVKTRLAVEVGDREAMKVFKKLVEHTQNICLSSGMDIRWYFSNYIPEDKKGSEKIHYFIQSEGDLGRRMELAFAESFDSPYDQVLIIGTDCPGLHVKHLRDALKALESNEVVFGPAIDGGYYLLGMRNFHKELFQEINWSSDQVLAQSIEKCKQHRWSWCSLTPLRDIDYMDDLHAEGLEDWLND